MSREHNEQIMRTYLEEVVGNGRLDLISEIANEDMVDETVPPGGPAGRDGLVSHVQFFRSVVGDRKIEIRRIVANEDEVMAWWTAHGTHIAEWWGVPPSGKPLSGHAFSFFDIRNGKISRYSLFTHIDFDIPKSFDSTAISDAAGVAD